MEVLLLGIEPHILSPMRKHLETLADAKVHVHSRSIEGARDLQADRWDLIFVGAKVRSHPDLASQIRSHRCKALTIVLTDKEKLRSTIDFWGTDVYNYLLTPINREFFHLIWQNAQVRLELGKKVSRLSQQQKKQRAGEIEQKEVLKSLFVTHLKMQELNQEQTNFLARTSHELTTPLTALQGYLQLMANGKAGDLSDLQSRIVRSSLDSCGRLLRLAQSLTDLVALDRSTHALQIGHGDIQQCLTRSISELSGPIKAKKLELEVENDGRIPQFGFDFDRMQQVIVNLVENAVKFTPEGGKVQVVCTPHFWERRSVREMIHGSNDRRGTTAPIGMNSVRIVVRDTGVGIPAEFLQDIFEEYSRVSSENGMPRGFGLGLAVARRIVQAHDGKIWAESKPGEGSTFTVLIPITA